MLQHDARFHELLGPPLNLMTNAAELPVFPHMGLMTENELGHWP